MRFMVQLRATARSESGGWPADPVGAMAAFNETLVHAGILLAVDNLADSSKGARLQWTNDNLKVVPGPFPNPRELIAGYWLVDVRSRDEAIAWFSRCPSPAGDGTGTLEIRQVLEPGSDEAGMAPVLCTPAGASPDARTAAADHPSH